MHKLEGMLPGGSGDGETGGDRAYVARRKRRKTAPAVAGPNGDANTSLPAKSDPAPPPQEAATPAAVVNAEDEAQEARWTRLEKGIHVAGDDVPPAVYSFESLPLPPPVHNTLYYRGLRAPTEVQAQTIPCVLRGRDVIALAATGSGKTLSYVLPLLVLAEQRRRQHDYQQWQAPYASSGMNHHVASPFALVLVPTRELMNQVLHELLSFPVLPAPHSQHHQGMSMPPPPPNLRPIPAVGICGGVSVHQQVAWLQSLAHELAAVVATPGRLLHLLDMKTPAVLDLRLVSYLVVDEVDRMLETEMELQLRQILHACASDSGTQRQTLLFSATMPHFLDRIARSTVVNAVTIRVGMGSQGTGAVASSSSSVSRRSDTAVMEGMEQNVLFMRFAEKKAKLLEVLRGIPRPPVLVFCNSHESVEFVTRLLQIEQFHVASLHGKQTQAYRFQALEAFREGFVDVLVATDLVSRGLDFHDVDHVIIFDMPHTIEDYVHRCGRTGRRREEEDAGGARRVGGKVTAFLTIECAVADDLKKMLEETKQPVPRELELPSRFHPPTR